MQPVLEVKNLRAAYGAREILKGVSFSLNADDFFATSARAVPASRP